MTQLWLKYRPTTLDHMVGLDALKADVKHWSVYENNRFVLKCGGVLFHGPPGTGKTASAHAIAQDLLGAHFAANYHVFNASDERGIQFVRDRLKGLAEQKAIGINFKIIVLDEADGLTRDAQDSMRQIIELTSTHTLWILTCNRISKVIPALRSRLPAYIFTPLSGNEAEDFLATVIESESFPQEWLASIPDLIYHYKGDLRSCLKTLQICNPENPHSLAERISENHDVCSPLYDTIIKKEWVNGFACCNAIIKAGASRDEAIEALHHNILKIYETGLRGDSPSQKKNGQFVALNHMLILGQWAARSPDWNAGDLLFLHAMLGDFNKRG